jgi:hypothetical protein
MVDEFQAHLFLEKRGETLTVAALREKLKVEVDIEKNRQVAFIEYALWKWGKKLVDMFFPDVPVDPAALAALEKAIDDYQKVCSQLPAPPALARLVCVCVCVAFLKFRPCVRCAVCAAHRSWR